jgi:hypothetical protein
MTQQSRMLLIILLLSIGGVSALMFVAQRYARVLERQAPAAAAPAADAAQSAAATESQWRREAIDRALEHVDGFIGVRRRLQAEIDRRGGRLTGPEAFSALRGEALTAAGIDVGVYRTVREQFRSWRSGRLDRHSLMAAAFERRRKILEQLDLGVHEVLDR